MHHGSNVLFDYPDLTKARPKRDFGLGFCTTSLRSQAAEWAINVTGRFGGRPVVYSFDLGLKDDLQVLRFPEITAEWLDMVRVNRLVGGIQHDYDVVIGPGPMTTPCALAALKFKGREHV
ncbi:MAG: DUF3990 domain-containing protein [Bifidobacteriaceae bacterium]|nr:DUF3990 domain-containing protein [Bifidobacteriaceae bacterium]